MTQTKFKILIVEDEVLIARDIKESLEELGHYTCVTASSVLSALKIVEDEHPDLVLIDIKLNGNLTGINLGKILLSKDKIPYIYLTSHTNVLTFTEAKNTRPAGFLVKPFKQNDLRIAIEIALNNFGHRKIDFSYNPGEFIKSDAPYKMQKIINYIHDNLDAKLSLADLAEIVEMSTFHFARTFKTYLHMAPANYIMKCKIEKSKVLLIETELTILQIALEIGFDNQSYFSQVFKKNTGSTPEYFRKVSLHNKQPI